MAANLEILKLNRDFPFQILINDGTILTAPHWHGEIELIYVAKGSISIGIDDIPYSLKQGEVALINSGLVHYVVSSSESERVVYQFDSAYFMGQNEERTVLSDAISKLKPISSQWTNSQAEKICLLLEDLKEEMDNQKIGYQLAVKSTIYQLLTLMVRTLPKQEAEKQSQRTENMIERLSTIFDYIETHYQTKISLEEMASAAGYSLYHFTRFFKKNTGKTFLTFLNEYRIDKAKWLLINSDLSVSEIILQTGFDSDKTFYRLFRKIMRVSPLEYRQRMRSI